MSESNIRYDAVKINLRAQFEQIFLALALSNSSDTGEDRVTVAFTQK